MIKIGLLQMNGCGNDLKASQAKGEFFCRRASAMGADIALFPEMWSNGQTSFDLNLPGAREQWQKQAINNDDPFIIHFRQLAKELKMAIAITYLENWPGAPRNTVSLI